MYHYTWTTFFSLHQTSLFINRSNAKIMHTFNYFPCIYKQILCNRRKHIDFVSNYTYLFLMFLHKKFFQKSFYSLLFFYGNQPWVKRGDGHFYRNVETRIIGVLRGENKSRTSQNKRVGGSAIRLLLWSPIIARLFFGILPISVRYGSRLEPYRGFGSSSYTLFKKARAALNNPRQQIISRTSVRIGVAFRNATLR